MSQFPSFVHPSSRKPSVRFGPLHEAGDVDLADVLRVMAGNAETARSTVALVKSLPATRPASLIETVLDTALITALELRDYTRLDATCGRLLTRRG